MLERAAAAAKETGLIGLDDQVRPRTARGRIIKGLKQSAPFSSLQRLIIFYNLVGLSVLVAGMTFLSNERRNLIEIYVDSLRKQGEVIAVSLAQSAYETPDGALALDRERATALLAGLVQPVGIRVRLYDSEPRLIADTYEISESAGAIEVEPLEPPKSYQSSAFDRFDSFVQAIGGFFRPEVEVYTEVPVPGVSDEDEVRRAAEGAISRQIRMNSQGELIVSLAMPIQRMRGIVGVLQLSTRGGEIEQLLHEERRNVLQIFVLAAIVSVLLSIILANMIASPIRLLAGAARVEGRTTARPLNPDRPEIPDLTDRTDEIGELSGALIGMTEALYARIGAIESFASDVAHELKNPLSSLRSAIETMQYAKTDEQRQKLLDVIFSDAARLDRLITDISNASRLDAELSREPMEPVDMAALIGAMVEMLQAQAGEAGVEIVTDLPRTGFEARGLEGRLAQVVTNLLANALSFSPQGGVIRVIGKVLSNGTIRVSVADQGPGIPPENLETIFRRFYSERPAREKFGSHSGLGLSISKQIVENHGGRIWAENIARPGDPEGTRRGARFVFDLPG